MTSSTALRIVGGDALALLHRIGTQKLDDLGPGQARATLFCDFRGRLLHRAFVARTSDGALWLLRDDAPGSDLAAFIDKHVFRDDVQIDDRSESLPVILTKANDQAPPIGAIDERDNTPVGVRVTEELMFVVGAADASPLSNLDRVRAAWPTHGREITDAFNPFEVNLAHEVHLDKGCFTGQEVLMRLVTYKSVKRRLARVSGDGAPPPTPFELRDGDQVAGVVTTAVADGSGWVGLAVVRNDVIDAARALLVAGGGSVQVEPLPTSRALGRP
jgi:folate-binding protein YgfZ